MYEEWAPQIDLSQADKDTDEPDRPWQLLPISKSKQKSRISKRNRAAISVLSIVLSSLGFPKSCIRRFLALCFADNSSEGNVFKFLSVAIELILPL